MRDESTRIVAGKATIERSRRVISVVACCHNVKLCALAAGAFRSQQNGTVTRMRSSCEVSGVQRSGDARSNCLIVCPPTEF